MVNGVCKIANIAGANFEADSLGARKLLNDGICDLCLVQHEKYIATNKMVIGSQQNSEDLTTDDIQPSIIDTYVHSFVGYVSNHHVGFSISKQKLNEIKPYLARRQLWGFFNSINISNDPKKLNYVDDQNSAEAWLIYPIGVVYSSSTLAANGTKMVGYIEYCLFLSHVVGWKIFEYSLLLDVLNSDIDGYPMAWSTCYFSQIAWI